MTLSDELAKLAARAKETETRAAAARSKARADLEQEVSSARAAAQEQGDTLRQKAADSEGRISDWWVNAQKSWNERIAAIQGDIETKKVEHDVGKARRKAERREDDAILAIDAAYWAVHRGRLRGARRGAREDGRRRRGGGRGRGAPVVSGAMRGPCDHRHGLRAADASRGPQRRGR